MEIEPELLAAQSLQVLSSDACLKTRFAEPLQVTDEVMYTDEVTYTDEVMWRLLIHEQISIFQSRLSYVKPDK